MKLIVSVILHFYLLSLYGAAEVVDEVIRKISKLELHAHLHGSVRRSTMLELASLNNITAPLKLSLDHYDHGLVDKPFELFPIIHSIVNSKEVLQRIVLEMIEDYEQLNTIYLEIRSTPRSLPDGTSIEEYLGLVTRVISEYNERSSENNMLVKLIVSIDRSKKYSDAIELLELVKKYMHIGRQKVIVAVDFSGNPLGGRFQDFAPLFTQAKQWGLNITVHTAELKQLSERENSDMDETSFILDFRPDRMGHMLYPMERHYDKMISLVQQNNAPLIEICPTTAFYLLGLPSYADHPHFRRLLSLHYPVAISTDDSGVFNTTLTQELLHVLQAFDLAPKDVLKMQMTALQYAFMTADEHEKLKKILVERSKEVVGEEIVAECLEEMEKKEEEIDMSPLYTM